jgi:hypothetical protein
MIGTSVRGQCSDRGAYPASVGVRIGVITGCAPGSPGCNQPPPLDGWITFWAPIVLVGIAVAVTVVSIALYRRRQRSRSQT